MPYLMNLPHTRQHGCLSRLPLPFTSCAFMLVCVWLSHLRISPQTKHLDRETVLSLFGSVSEKISSLRSWRQLAGGLGIEKPLLIPAMVN